MVLGSLSVCIVARPEGQGGKDSGECLKLERRGVADVGRKMEREECSRRTGVCVGGMDKGRVMGRS